MKKTFLLIFIGLFLIFPKLTQAEEIKLFFSETKINKDGTINVYETIAYDFGDLNKHGIYRNIPKIKTNQQGQKFQMDIQPISVTDENGEKYQYQIINSPEQIQFKIGDPNKTITGPHNYEISYKVSGALSYFSDHDEFYWNINGNDWLVPISLINSKVELPVNVSQDNIKTICYTGSSGSTQSDCTTNYLTNIADYQSTRSFSSGEGMTIDLSFPKNIVVVLEPKSYVPFWETPLGKLLVTLFSIFIVILIFCWYVVYPIWLPIKWFLYGRDPKAITGSVRAWYDPPKTVSGRFLTPGETGTIIDERVDMRDISGTIIHLAQRGYFKIVEKNKRDFSFIKTENFKSNDQLIPFEKKLIDGLFEDGNELRLKDAELYDTIHDVNNMIYKDMVTIGFFSKDPNKTRIYYGAIAGIALFTFNIPLAFFAFIFGFNMPKKSVAGVDAANVAKSLKNFLSTQQRELEFQAKNQMFFEKLLPFAIAFGVERVWAERFKDINMTQPNWYQGYGTSNFSSIYFASSLGSSLGSFKSAATPTSSSSGFSSGFSGGSSGGGGGGGGGGSW